MDFRKNPFLDPQDDLERQQTSPRIHKNLAPRPHKNFIPVNLCQRRGLTRGAYKSTTIVNIYAYIALCQNNIRMNDNRQRWTNRGTEQRRRPTCTARPVLRQGSSSSMTQAACSLSHSGGVQRVVDVVMLSCSLSRRIEFTTRISRAIHPTYYSAAPVVYHDRFSIMLCLLQNNTGIVR